MSWKDVEVSGGGGIFLNQSELKDGDNRIRICSVPLAVWKGYPADGKPGKCVTFATQKEADAYNARFDSKTEEGRKQMAKQRHYCFVIDRETGTPKVFDMGASITGQIRDLASDADYGFEDIPSYDVKVKKSGKGMDTEYKVLPCPSAELTAEEKAVVKAFAEKTGSLKSIAFGNDAERKLIESGLAPEDVKPKAEPVDDLPEFLR